MFYAKNPFLTVGLPFLSAVLAGTFILVDLRKSRYEVKKNARQSGCSEVGNEGKRTLRTLEEELVVKYNFVVCIRVLINCYVHLYGGFLRNGKGFIGIKLQEITR